MVRELQDNQYGGNKTSVFLDGNQNFVALAQIYGIPSVCVQTDTDVASAIDTMLSADGPYLLECTVSPSEPTL